MAHEITPRTVYCIQCDAFHNVNEHCPNAHRVRTCEHGYNVKDFCYRCTFPIAYDARTWGQFLDDEAADRRDIA